MQYPLIYLCLRPYPAAGAAACDCSLRPAVWPGPGRCSAAAGAARPPVQRGSRRPAVIGPANGCRFGPPDPRLSVRPAVAGPARGCRSGPRSRLPGRRGSC